jgi:hypothetical protein
MRIDDTIELFPVVLSRLFFLLNVVIVVFSGLLLFSIHGAAEASNAWTSFGREYYLTYNLFTSFVWSLEVFWTVNKNFDFRRWIFQLIFATYCAIQSSAIITFIVENELYQEQKLLEETDVAIRMVAYLIEVCLESMYLYSSYYYTDPLGVYDPLGEVDVRVAQHL